MQITKPRFLRRDARGQRGQLVTNGRVACVRSAAGDVDVDRCLSCPLLENVRVDEAGREWVSCRPAAHLLTSAELRAI